MKQHRFAFILLALFATTLFLPALLRREVFALRDHFDYFQPLRWFTALPAERCVSVIVSRSSER